MSYSVHAYLTNSTKIKALYGSKDKVKFDELKTKLGNDLKELDKYFSDSLPSGVSFANILVDVFNGTIRYPYLGYMYVYIYEKLVHYCGEEVYVNENTWEFDPQSSFIPIPYSNDFPYVISIETKDLVSKKDQYMCLKEDEGIGYYDFEEEMSDLEFILDEAIEKNKDLVIFVY